MQRQGIEPWQLSLTELKTVPLTARASLLPIYYITKSLSHFLLKEINIIKIKKFINYQ
jgi:hypothetical protein